MKHTYSIVTEGDFSKQVYTVIGANKAIVYEYTDYGKPVTGSYDGIMVQMTYHYRSDADNGYECNLLSHADEIGYCTFHTKIMMYEYPVATIATMIERGDPVQDVLKRIEEICL